MTVPAVLQLESVARQYNAARAAKKQKSMANVPFVRALLSATHFRFGREKLIHLTEPPPVPDRLADSRLARD
jgi:hypothetical protein